MGTRKKNRLVGVGGLAALANKDCWQARPRLTLTYHVMFVFKQKAKKNLVISEFPSVFLASKPPSYCRLNNGRQIIGDK